MTGKKILVAGELNIDLILNEIHGFPRIGEEITANKMNITLGSSSAIFACNIATLGVNTAFAGMIGDDSFGRFIIKELKNKDINTDLVIETTKHNTGVTVVLNYDQDRANVTHCGAMNFFSAASIPLNKLSQFDHLHFSSYFLQKAMQKDIAGLFRSAKEKGLSTSLDLQWDPGNKWDFPYKDCLPFVDLFLPNESEIILLAEETDLENAVNKIGEFANKIIVKRGIRGAVCYERGKFTSSDPFLHDCFVDAIGAGDSFNAGFVYKFLEGSSLEEALRFANLAGAINTTESGGTLAFSSLSAFKNKVKKIFNIIL
jgi:sugar/nucleoside kinase (ribokinase family)